jgi:hypothetical protein
LHKILTRFSNHWVKSVGWERRCMHEWWSVKKKWVPMNHECKSLGHDTFICATKCGADVNMAHVSSSILTLDFLIMFNVNLWWCTIPYFKHKLHELW